MSFEIGARVETEKTGKGRVAFCGEVQFSDGEWVGVILDEPRGKNNGTVQGVQYFTCEPNHGLFIRPTQLKAESARPRASGLRTPAPRKEVAAPTKVARSSPSGSPKVSPSVSMERLSKAAGPKRVMSSSKLVDNANEPKMSREPSNLSQAGSEKGEKQEKAKDTEKAVDKNSAKPESVMDKVKKLQESASPMTPLSPVHTTIPTGMDEGTEQEYLRLQVKDLSEKLETLRLKRKEDHGKLVDYERSKIQLQALMELKSKMADQLLDLQRQLQEARKEALESREWKEANQDELSSAAEQLEMATIDKEMAEERAEALQSELDSLKLRNEELEADLEILREEMAAGGGGVISEGNSVQLKQLELQNERLKEALIKLRDINAAAQAEKQAAVREAEILRTENVELVRAAEIARKTALDSDMRIHDYQEQIVELHAWEELQQRMKQEEDHRDELVSTIMKFRKKVGEQNEEIQELKDQVLRYQEELSGHKSEENTMASIVSQMQVNVNRTFAESVERQVAAIEVEYARKQMGYLKQFLPDNFTKAGGDNDAVVLNVLFPRLAAKAKLLTKLIAERFPGVPGGTRREHVTKSHKAEHWAHSARIAYMMNALVAVCGQFESALGNISLEDLSRLAQLQPEMTAQERVIDGYLELLKQSRLDAETSLENMEKVVTYFQNVLSVNVSADSYDTPTWLRNVCQQLVSGVAWCKVNNQRISFFLKPGLEGCDVSELVRTIGDELAQCEQLAIRAGKRVPTDANLKLTPQISDDIQSALHNMDRFALILHETCGIASVQLNINPVYKCTATYHAFQSIAGYAFDAFNIQRLESRAPSPSMHASSPVGLSLGREEAALLEQQLSDNREALRRATLQIIQLKADLSLAQSRGGVMRLPDMVCGPETLKAKENDAVLEAISKEVEQLKRDELKYKVFIPDPSRSRHLQEQDRARFEKEQEAYNYRVQTLRSRLHHYWKEMCPGQPFPNLFGLPAQKQPKVRDVKYGTQAFKDIVNNWGVKA
ncbi:hypothetical protein GCK32_004969 [Trichostrongylus colubriformis]|uniref:Dynactin subunit 1 n=1 Tax=Trichostrongylus colubriformis TaxID=6319 RepID=A0AAN8G7S5_TRICO